MKVAVRYQSRSGNTKKVADAVAKAAGVQALDVENPLAEPADVLFLGGAIYAGGLHGKLKKFIKGLREGAIGKIVLFSTAMGPKNIGPKVEALLKGKNIPVEADELHIRSGELLAEDPQQYDAAMEKAARFAKKLVE
jgi:flavodoxin